jgi:hypothetical protein
VIITLLVLLVLFISLAFLLIGAYWMNKGNKMVTEVEKRVQRKQTVIKILEERVKATTYTLRAQKKQIQLMEEFLQDIGSEEEFILQKSALYTLDLISADYKESEVSDTIDSVVAEAKKRIKNIIIVSKKDFTYAAIIEKYFKKPESNLKAIADLEAEAAMYDGDDAGNPGFGSFRDEAYDTEEVDTE